MTEIITREVRLHDQFNMVALSVIVFFDVSYLILTTDIEKIGTDEIGLDYYPIFLALITSFTIYLVIDVFYIFYQPSSVLGQPNAIIAHHLLTLGQLIIPWLNQTLSWHLAITLIVEINSLVLTFRRNSHKDSISYKILNVLFYITWFLFRLILFPILSVFFYYEYIRCAAKLGYYNTMAVGFISQSLLTLMSYKWTYDIYMKFFSNKSKKSS